MDLDAKYVNDVRAGARCCHNGKMVEFESGHLCMTHAPEALKDVAVSDGTSAAVEVLKKIIPDWDKIKWKRSSKGQDDFSL